MVIAVCSDVHAHTTRLRAFARQARSLGAEELWCLGDVVDSMIGAPPKALAATVDAALEECDLVLGGNHELWALQRDLLAPATAREVSGWRPAEERHGVVCVHASLDDPVMEFVDTPAKAARTLRQSPADWLTVHGHTHRRRLWRPERGHPGAVSVATRGTVEAGPDGVLACPGALTGARPTWLLVDLDARRLHWVALAEA